MIVTADGSVPEAPERRDAARELAQLGFPVLPLHTPRLEGAGAKCSCGRADCNGSAGKHPRTAHGFREATVNLDTIDRWWGAWPDANIGWRMGDGYFAVDIDPAHGGDAGLDGLVAKHGPLPETLTILTGGGGRHLIFRAPEGVPIKPSVGALAPGVDIHGDGSYLVAPGSIHASGREYVVDDINERVTLDMIVEAPAWLVELARAHQPAQPAQPAASSEAPANGGGDVIRDGQRNETLTSLAGTMRRRGMPESAIAAALLETNRQQCLPPLPEDEVRGIARSVARYEPAAESAIGPDGLVPLGQRDPDSGRLVLSPKRTLPTAQAYEREFHQHPGGRTLRGYGGLMLEWRDNRYTHVEDDAIKHRLQPWLHEARRYMPNRRTGVMELVPFDSNPTTVNAALESIRSFTFLPASTRSPSWLDDDGNRLPALEILPCRTMSLHIPTGTVIPATPALFTVNALDFDYDPDPEPPLRWIKLLEQIWEDDLESVQLLQEWMGYCLLSDTSQQKMLLLVGPRRSGKGTIGRILTRLVGSANVIGPTTGSLAGDFGLQPLIDKSLAIVSDARFSGPNVATVVERLLCISGEDTLTVHRKFLGAVSMKLPTRFMFLTNELPRLTDASTALAGRFLILKLTNSFYGREDPTLTDQLVEELPGILLWAIDGWKRLRERGRFQQPASSAEAIQEMADLASPVAAFVRERCEVGVGHRAFVDDLYAAWKQWCQDEGRDITTTRQVFGRDLTAAFPAVTRRRGTSQVAFYEGIRLAGEYQV